MKSILDPAFKYVPSVKTDIRETFKRVRREQARVALPGHRQVIALRPKERKQ